MPSFLSCSGSCWGAGVCAPHRYTPRDVAWLSSLVGLDLPEAGEEEREEGEGSTAAVTVAVAADCKRSLPPPPELEPSTSREGEEETQQGLLPLPVRLRDPDALADLVQANCLEPDGGAEDEYVFWARHEVTAATTAASASSPLSPPSLSSSSLPSSFRSSSSLTGSMERPRRRRGPMGLWPEAAMLNHSCLPNTVAYIVGDTLFVRAARKVGGGSELTVSYLPVGSGYESAAGDESDDIDGDTDDASAAAAAATLLSPLAERRTALEGLRGFVCRCNRCTAEEALDPKLRALMADISEGVAALQGDLQTALALSDLEDGAGDGEDEEEAEDEEEREHAEERSGKYTAEASSSGVSRMDGQGPSGRQSQPLRQDGTAGGDAGRNRQQPQQRRRRPAGREDDEVDEEEEGEHEEEEDGGRWRQMVGSVVDRAGLYLELMDAAMVKLKLTPAQQITVQSAVAPLYTVLWAGLGARGELEPRLAEVMAALVGEVTPGSADHLWWAVVARETAEMIVAEEEALEEATVVRRAGGGGGGGFSRRPQDDRVTIADKACYKAFGIRYGPISRDVYRRLLAARRQREDAQTE
ncbi:hypothetical protein Vretimale_18572 [Volvox reticuliferus]|uniref:Uncharacterized protein n=1 Tax=Volvox reticuliferus TaxID=1737510 RepID=A0A8J4D0K5_9CHLO|nr:hypothetical protein Vretifemale_17080 [Volvox reticuliferus]GIM15912.1 hypothetical protein Vretimale_18572 [Volvox reticuliferus]